MRQSPGQPGSRLTPARGNAFQIFLVAAAVLGLGLGLAFGGGVLYGRRGDATASATQATAAAGAAGARPPSAAGGAAAPTTGVVESIAGDTVTIRTSAGGTVSVKLVADTQIRQTVGATAADIRPGNTLVVTGQPDVDGKVAARTVQISPAGGPGGGAPGGTPGAGGAGRPTGTAGAGGAPGGPGRGAGTPAP